MKRARSAKGTRSVGVAAQYSGTVGKIANCQIGVFLAYATGSGAVLLDRELYLHADWAKDSERCKEADVPEERRKTIKKPTLAKQMLERAFAHGVTGAWVTGDTVYGGDTKLRSWLEERLQPYVLAMPMREPPWAHPACRRGRGALACSQVAALVSRRRQSRAALLRWGLAVPGLPVDRARVEAVAARAAQPL